MGAHAHFVILSSIDLGSRMKVGNVTRLKSAPGRSWEMMWERTVEGRMGSVKVSRVACLPAWRLIDYTDHCPDQAQPLAVELAPDSNVVQRLLTCLVLTAGLIGSLFGSIGASTQNAS